MTSSFPPWNPTWYEEPPYTRQGWIEYPCNGNTYKLWYGIAGDGPKTPLFVQHGGPGIDHTYLITLQGLGFERPVVFYDQLGCGLSDRPDDPSLWTIERAVEEAEFMRKALGLSSIHLYGSSYASQLAASYALTYPAAIRSLTLSSPFLDMPRYASQAIPAVKANLPAEVVRTIDDFELRGEGTPEAYDAAALVYWERYYCLKHPFPWPMEHIADRFNPQIMETMWGSDLNVTGQMKEYNVTGQLHTLPMPVFMHCGRHDFSRPEELAYYHSFLPSARTYIFEQSAHLAMLDAPEEYLQVMHAFLCEVESSLPV